MVNETVKFSIQLPKLYDRRLRIWAKLKGQTRASLAANIVQARIESNWKELKNDLLELAELEGITVEDLMKEILNSEE